MHVPIDYGHLLIPMDHDQEELIRDQRLWNHPHHLIDDEGIFSKREKTLIRTKPQSIY